jgi:hypothetical protein
MLLNKSISHRLSCVFMTVFSVDECWGGREEVVESGGRRMRLAAYPRSNDFLTLPSPRLYNALILLTNYPSRKEHQHAGLSSDQ